MKNFLFILMVGLPFYAHPHQKRCVEVSGRLVLRDSRASGPEERPLKIGDPVSKARDYLRTRRSASYSFARGAEGQIQDSQHMTYRHPSFGREDVLNAIDEGSYRPKLDRPSSQRGRRGMNYWNYAIEGPTLDERQTLRVFINFNDRYGLSIVFIQPLNPSINSAYIPKITPDKLYDAAQMAQRFARHENYSFSPYAKALMTEKSLDQEDIKYALIGSTHHRSEDYLRISGSHWNYSLTGKTREGVEIRMVVQFKSSRDHPDRKFLFVNEVWFADEPLEVPRDIKKLSRLPERVADPLKEAQDYIRRDSYSRFYTDHALGRMEERNIEESDVVYVLRNGRHNGRLDTYSWDSNRGWRYAIEKKTPGGRNLRVVINLNREFGMTIVTAMDMINRPTLLQ